MILRQTTTASITVGPILDTDGVAKTNEVVGSIRLSKNGGVPAAPDGSATLTHRHTGVYTLALQTADTGTVGTLEVSLDSTTNAMAIKQINVVEEAVYDAVYAGSAVGPATATQGTSIQTKTDFLPSATAGAAGGIFIAGTNAATTITSAAGNALTLNSTGSNGHGLAATGNGTGVGIRGQGGATGQGILGVGGATSGAGIRGTGTAGNAQGIYGVGQGSAAGVGGLGGATGAGILGTGGATSGSGIQGTGAAGNSQGILGAGQGTAAGIRGTGGTTGAGILGVGGATSGSGIRGDGTAGNSSGIQGIGQGSGHGLLGTAGSTGNGINGTGGATSGSGIRGTGTNGNSHGIYGVGQGSASGVSGLGGATGHGILGTGGTNGDGIKGALGGTGVDIRGNITGDITGNLSGTAGSVTGAVGSVTGAVGSVTAAITLPTIPANWLTAAGLAADAVNEIADQVWEEAIADHSGTSGSTAEALAAAGSAGDPWITALPGAYGAGTAGFILGTNLDAVLTDRTLAAAAYFDPAADTVATVTTVSNAITLPSIPTDWITAAGLAGDAVNQIVDTVWEEAQASHVSAGSFGEIATEIATLLTRCSEIRLAELDAGNLPTDVAAIDAIATAIQVTTDKFVFTVANQVDVNLKSWLDLTPTALVEITDILSDGTALNTTAGVLDAVATVTTLTNLPAIPANWLTSAGIAASALDGKGDWSTHAATDIVSAGAITTSGGAVSTVTTVTTTTTNTDMRGTDNAALATVCTEARLAELNAANLPADLDAVKSKTDQFAFTVGNQVDSNVQYVNDVQLTGTGVLADEWGPV